MNHLAMLLFIGCCILDAATIFISTLLYRKYKQKAFNYLAILIFGTLLSMLVEAVHAYGVIAAADIENIERIAYLTLEPIGEIITFIMLPVVAFSAAGKEFSGRLSLACKVYALLVVATFPLEVVFGNPYINRTRELTGYFVFHLSAYIIIFRYYSNVKNLNLKTALRNYLILGVVIIPTGVFVRTEIPFPYIIYCISFNLLCIFHTFKYLFAPVIQGARKNPEGFLERYGITERESEIIDLLLQGYSNKLISDTLFISIKTVKNHIYSIYRKTDVKSRMQLANRIKLCEDISEPL